MAFSNDQEPLPLWREQGKRESLECEAGPGKEKVRGKGGRASLHGQLDGLPDKKGDSPEHKVLMEAPGCGTAAESRGRGFFLKSRIYA